jgi:hypothetical protein
MDLAIHVQLAHAAGQQLGVLGTVVEDEDLGWQTFAVLDGPQRYSGGADEFIRTVVPAKLRRPQGR